MRLAWQFGGRGEWETCVVVREDRASIDSTVSGQELGTTYVIHTECTCMHSLEDVVGPVLGVYMYTNRWGLMHHHKHYGMFSHRIFPLHYGTPLIKGRLHMHNNIIIMISTRHIIWHIRAIPTYGVYGLYDY